MEQFSVFAKTILETKYAHTKPDGRKETWMEVAKRVATNVIGTRLNGERGDIQKAIEERKLMPAGRYLYCAGRKKPHCNNCALYRAEDDTEQWGELAKKCMVTLMRGAGVGVSYSRLREKDAHISGMGGRSSGPIALACSINEIGRGTKQGGDRRSAIWAGLLWSHPDCREFIGIKDWPDWLKERKAQDYTIACPMDMTNISVILDDEFFEAYREESHPKHLLARDIYWRTVNSMCRSGEPGFSINVGEDEGEDLRNACVPGSTQILTSDGYRPIESMVGKFVKVWNGREWSEVMPKQTGANRELVKVTLSDGCSLTCTLEHKFLMGDGTRKEASALLVGEKLLKTTYPVVANGQPLAHAYSQGFFAAEGFIASRDGAKQAWVYGPKRMCLPRLTAISYRSDWDTEQDRCRVRFDDTHISNKYFVPFDADVAGRIDWLAGLLDGDATETAGRKGGSVQLASTSELFLSSIRKLLTTLGVTAKVTKMRDEGSRDIKGVAYTCQAMYRLHIPGSQISKLSLLGMHCERLPLCGKDRDNSRSARVVSVEPAGFADAVYCFNEPILHAGVFEGVLTGQCTEVTSRKDNDLCSLASINIAKIDSISAFRAMVRSGIAFLLCGNQYSAVPSHEAKAVRLEDQRIGLGLMGIHEWLLKRGKRYGPDRELQDWLDVYREESDAASRHYANLFGINIPIANRSIAPCGTISIVAETTSSAEPVLAAAFLRRYLKCDRWHAQYVVDACAHRLVEQGIDPDDIEDAYDLAGDVERRLAFQAWLQKDVDQAISSTINMPSWGSPGNNEDTVQQFGQTLMKHLPFLRGITVYPDGSRGGQPLTKVPYREAIQRVGVEFEENGNSQSCSNGICGA